MIEENRDGNLPINGNILLFAPHIFSPIETEAIRIFSERCRERSGRSVDFFHDEIPEGTFLIIVGVSGPTISTMLDALGIKQRPGPEGYILYTGRSNGKFSHTQPEDCDNFAIVCGSDSHGVLYGLGRLLRIIDFDDEFLYVPATLEITQPASRERIVYFATHFNNWYECAPDEDIQRYIEDLALWGFNGLWTWLDMNWFPFGFWKNTQSRGMRMVQRIRMINKKARSLGMAVGSIGIANEGFASQPPPELRTDISVRRGGFYPDSQICPSKPGGLQMILEDRRKILKLIGPIDFFCSWPYDQGGCGCKDCADENGWGKTFLAISQDIARLVKDSSPEARFIISTWYMSDREMELVYEQANLPDRWFDGLLIETRRVGEPKIPSDMFLSVFSEISMFDCFFVSYGCNGANPAVRRFVDEASRIADLEYGVVLYSEGIYEDINKITWAAVMWNSQQTPENIAKEYSHFYFGYRNAEMGKELILDLEQTWGLAKLPKVSLTTALSLFNSIRSLEKHLPPTDWSRCRWLSLYYRAKIDYLMLKVGPSRGLLEETKHLFDFAGYTNDLSALRKRLEALHIRIVKRNSDLDNLFETYYKYLQEFHLDTSMLIFRPDQYVGSEDFRSLFEGCAAALNENCDESMRRRFIRTIHRWVWCNSIGVDYFFL